MFASFSFSSGDLIAVFVAPFRLFTTSFGSPAGPTIANQAVMSKPGSVSEIAGQSGTSALRFAEVTPSWRIVPPLTWAIALPMSTKVKSSVPPSTSLTASGMPL